MKKENSSNFFCSKFFMVMLFALGITLFSNTNANAQQGTPLDSEIAAMTEQRDSFAPGSAKYDLSQDALDYLVILDNSISSDPNYLNIFQDQFQSDPFKAVPLRKAHPSVVANYTAAELAAFQNQVDGGTAAPVSQKLQYILDANAY